MNLQPQTVYVPAAMKTILLIFLFPVMCQAQQSFIIMMDVPDVKGTVKNVYHTTYKWNKDSVYSICGLKHYCQIPWEHYILIGKIPKEPDGVPIYGAEGALIGYLTKYGFAATFHRDHLAGKYYDLELLENPEKMKLYLVKIGIQ